MSAFGDVVDVRDVLRPPQVGSAALLLPHDWIVWDALFVKARDGINLLAGIADRVPGVDVPRLPEGSLADLIVKPFCGDWDRIRANGEACRVLGRGMSGLARNLLVLPLDLTPYWSGQTMVRFAAHHLSYALAIEFAGDVVARGQIAFDSVSEVSQRVGETAIRLLTRLGQLLIRVARKVARRLAPYVGWLATVKDVLVDGIGPILDVVADLRETVALVQALLALLHRVTSWLEEARADLMVFASLPAILDGLPSVGSSP